MITAKTNSAVVEHPAAFTAVWATSALTAAAVSTKAIRDRVPTRGMTNVVFGQAHRPRRKPF